MSKTITISDDTAALLEARRRAEGQPTLDEAAEKVLARGLAAEEESDLLEGYSIEELRALIAEGEEGPFEVWDAEAVRAEILRRHSERQGQ